METNIWIWVAWCSKAFNQNFWNSPTAVLGLTWNESLIWFDYQNILLRLKLISSIMQLSVGDMLFYKCPLIIMPKILRGKKPKTFLKPQTRCNSYNFAPFLNKVTLHEPSPHWGGVIHLICCAGTVCFQISDREPELGTLLLRNSLLMRQD